MPPRVGGSLPGRKKKAYDLQAFEEAVRAVKDKTMSFREAASHFCVPKTTLLDRVNKNHGPKDGRRPVLLYAEEKRIVEAVKLCGTWGFPFGQMDLCRLVKDYLDSKGATTIFKDNLPSFRFDFHN